MGAVEKSDGGGFSFPIWLRTGRLIRMDARWGAREVKFNPYHEFDTGRFTFADGGGYAPNAGRSKNPRLRNLDLDKVTKTVRQNASDKSRGQCARYCRMALEAGGADTTGHPVAAKDYGPVLERNGFTPVSENDYTPKSGDVVVFSESEAHKYGHIAIYDGSAWCSDFKQRSMSPYRGEAPPHTVYRHGK